MSARHTHKSEHDAHMSTVVDPWIPILLVHTEIAMLSSNMDPKSWKEAMTSYNVAEWVEGFREEMIYLQAQNVFTLILKSSVPVGC